MRIARISFERPLRSVGRHRSLLGSLCALIGMATMTGCELPRQAPGLRDDMIVRIEPAHARDVPVDLIAYTIVYANYLSLATGKSIETDIGSQPAAATNVRLILTDDPMPESASDVPGITELSNWISDRMDSQHIQRTTPDGSVQCIGSRYDQPGHPVRYVFIASRNPVEFEAYGCLTRSLLWSLGIPRPKMESYYIDEYGLPQSDEIAYLRSMYGARDANARAPNGTTVDDAVASFMIWAFGSTKGDNPENKVFRRLDGDLKVAVTGRDAGLYMPFLRVTMRYFSELMGVPLRWTQQAPNIVFKIDPTDIGSMISEDPVLTKFLGFTDEGRAPILAAAQGRKCMRVTLVAKDDGSLKDELIFLSTDPASQWADFKPLIEAGPKCLFAPVEGYDASSPKANLATMLYELSHHGTYSRREEEFIRIAYRELPPSLPAPEVEQRVRRYFSTRPPNW